MLIDVAELKEQLEQDRKSKRKTKSVEDAVKLTPENTPIQIEGDDENQVQLLRRIIAEQDKTINENEKALEERDNTIAALRRELAAASAVQRG